MPVGIRYDAREYLQMFSLEILNYRFLCGLLFATKGHKINKADLIVYALEIMIYSSTTTS